MTKQNKSIFVGVLVALIILYVLKKKGIIGGANSATSPIPVPEIMPELPTPLDATLEVSDNDNFFTADQLINENGVSATGGTLSTKAKDFPCFCNGSFVGWMKYSECADKCAPVLKSGLRPRFSVQRNTYKK